MLELRPSCEHCNQALPPAAENARICSFECTFCAACVTLLENVCPNCGGGLNRRCAASCLINNRVDRLASMVA